MRSDFRHSREAARTSGPAGPRRAHGEDGDPGPRAIRPRFECHGVTEVGSARAVNEDEFVILPLFHALQGVVAPSPGRPATLMAVADGVGGAPAGERASTIVIETLRRHVKALLPRLALPGSLGNETAGILRWIATECQREVEEDLKDHPELAGMGTTLTAALVMWPRMFGVHVGHSRCYLLRRARLERLTVDHTVSQRLADLGALPPSRVRSSPWRNTLWNVIGGSTSGIVPQIFERDLQCGDTLLLTTDGVTETLSDEELRRLMAEGGTAEAMCRRLTQTAQTRGGRDDRTAVCARFGPSTLWHRIREVLIGG
ncbi:MAG TPA: protein phosphatase 2C domain-containing protein [Planctomycetota bacterium]|nr:protein phosphatase 2C domain-containing protein [Planctomycetota bacterium]